MSIKSIEFHVNERDEAARRLHWHLSRAACGILLNGVLGPDFEREMLLAERARSDWHAAHTAIFSSSPAVRVDAN